MTDANLDPKLDLQISTLRQLCRGDVTRLPSFIVHDDEAWPWYNQVRPSKGDIHIRRSTFNRVVVGKVPLQPGLWVRQDAQQFFIDNHQAARGVAMADEAGRLPDEADYGAKAMERSEGREIDRGDLERIARDPERGSVRSTAISPGDTERALAEGDND